LPPSLINIGGWFGNSTEIKSCNGSLRTTVRLRAPPPKIMKEGCDLPASNSELDISEMPSCCALLVRDLYFSSNLTIAQKPIFLDVGCGTGLHMLDYSKFCHSVHGIEREERWVKHVNDRHYLCPHSVTLANIETWCEVKEIMSDRAAELPDIINCYAGAAVSEMVRAGLTQDLLNAELKKNVLVITWATDPPYGPSFGALLADATGPARGQVNRRRCTPVRVNSISGIDGCFFSLAFGDNWKKKGEDRRPTGVSVYSHAMIAAIEATGKGKWEQELVGYASFYVPDRKESLRIGTWLDFNGKI